MGRGGRGKDSEQLEPRTPGRIPRTELQGHPESGARGRVQAAEERFIPSVSGAAPGSARSALFDVSGARPGSVVG